MSDEFDIVSPDVPSSQPGGDEFDIVPSSIAENQTQKISPNPGMLANAPNESNTSAFLKGAATAGIQGVADVPGIPGNIESLTNYLLKRAYQARHGDYKGQQPVNFNPDRYFPTGDELAAPILKETGEYVPQTELGRMAMTGARTATSIALPGGLIKGTTTLAGGADALSALSKGAATAKALAPGAAISGATGQLGTDISGDPLVGLATGIVGPAAISTGASKLTSLVPESTRNSLSAMVPGNRPAMADQMLYNAATSPEKVVADTAFQPKNIVEGSEPSLAELTGDPGLAQAEKAAMQNPQFAATQQARIGEQNVSRANMLNDTVPQTADIMSPATFFAKKTADLNLEHDANINSLQQAANDLNSRMPNAVHPEDMGTALRSAMQQYQDAFSQQKSALYKIVDNNGSLNVVTSGPRDAALNLAKEINPAAETPSPLLTEPLNMVSNLKEVTPFKTLVTLDTTVTQAMAEARKTGDLRAAGRLGTLKSSLMDAMNNAIENQHEWEQKSVAAGTIGPESTIEGRIRALGENTNIDNTGRETGTNGITSAVGRTTSPTTELPENNMGGSEADGRLRSAASTQGVPPAQSEAPRQPFNLNPKTPGEARQSARALFGESVEPKEPQEPVQAVPQLNMTKEAAQALQAAKQAHIQDVNIFRKEPVKSALATNGFNGQYLMRPSALPQKAFIAGDRGYETANAFLKATDNSPEAISAMKDMAISRLRDSSKGEVSQASLDTWKSKHANALRAVDEVSPGFSKSFNNTASANTALENAQSAKIAAMKLEQAGAAGKLIGANYPSEVKAQAGMLLRAKDGPTQIAALMDRMQGNPDAIEGLRRAAIENIMDSVSNYGTQGGSPIVSGAKLSSLLKNNGAAIETMLGREGINNLRNISADASRTEQLLSLTKARNGSDTGQNIHNQLNEIAKNASHISVGSAMSIAGMEAFQQGHFLGVAGIAGMAAIKAAFSKLRAAGINSAHDMYLEGLQNPDLGAAMIQRAINKNGTANVPAFTRLGNAALKAVQMFPQLQQSQPQNQPRLAPAPYAKGGKVIKSHQRLVDRLMNLAEQAKKVENNKTKPLLKAPDEAVVKALAITKRGI